MPIFKFLGYARIFFCSNFQNKIRLHCKIDLQNLSRKFFKKNIEFFHFAVLIFSKKKVEWHEFSNEQGSKWKFGDLTKPPIRYFHELKFSSWKKEPICLSKQERRIFLFIVHLELPEEIFSRQNCKKRKSYYAYIVCIMRRTRKAFWIPNFHRKMYVPCSTSTGYNGNETITRILNGNINVETYMLVHITSKTCVTFPVRVLCLFEFVVDAQNYACEPANFQRSLMAAQTPYTTLLYRFRDIIFSSLSLCHCIECLSPGYVSSRTFD